MGQEFKAEYDEINDVRLYTIFIIKWRFQKAEYWCCLKNLYQDYKILVAVDVNNGGEILWEKSEDSELGFEHYDDWVSLLSIRIPSTFRL